MSVTQTVLIPDNRRLIIDVPREVPTGSVILTFTPTSSDPINADDECPMCAKRRDTETGEMCFNAETITAFDEGDAMLRGGLSAKRFNSLEEMLSDLDSDD
ncbi:MAG: hypothetical protein LBG93_08640 [Treponema sp.]|jgi:hypothetical protein|nr:hypothetical protein [Treponema sp.]